MIMSYADRDFSYIQYKPTNSQQQSGINTLWMGDLDSYMDERFLMEAFASLGEHLSAVKIIQDSKSGYYDHQSGTTLGYCFLEFATYEQAKRVLLKLNGKIVPNSQPPRRFKLNEASYSKEHKVQGPEFSLFVGDLTSEVDDYLLYMCFQGYKSCKNAKVVVGADGESKGFGFVRFGNETDQQTALIDMQGHRGCGRKPLRVSLAQPKRPRQPGGGAATPGAATGRGQQQAQGGYYGNYNQAGYDYTSAAAGGYGMQPAAGGYDPNYYGHYAAYDYANQQYYQQQQQQQQQQEQREQEKLKDENDDLELEDHSAPLDVDAENEKVMQRYYDLHNALESCHWFPHEELQQNLLQPAEEHVKS